MRKPRFTDKQCTTLVKEYKSGSTVRDLAVAFDCSTPTVIKALHRGGLKKLRIKGRRKGQTYKGKKATETKHDIAYRKVLRAEAKKRAEKNAKDRQRRKAATKPKPKAVKATKKKSAA